MSTPTDVKKKRIDGLLKDLETKDRERGWASAEERREEVDRIKREIDSISEEETVWCDAPGCEGCTSHCSVMESLGRKKPRNEKPFVSWWWWTTLEMPKNSQQRADFILIIITILSVEFGGGVFLGFLLRSIFG